MFFVILDSKFIYDHNTDYCRYVCYSQWIFVTRIVDVRLARGLFPRCEKCTYELLKDVWQREYERILYINCEWPRSGLVMLRRAEHFDAHDLTVSERMSVT